MRKHRYALPAAAAGPTEEQAAELLPERSGITIAERADVLGVGVKRISEIISPAQARGRVRRVLAAEVEDG